MRRVLGGWQWRWQQRTKNRLSSDACCKLEWCQSTNTVDLYGHKLKSRSDAERISWLTTLRPGDSTAQQQARASEPGNLRAHTSHFRYYHKEWSNGEQRKHLRLKEHAVCCANRVHNTPQYPGEKLEENPYDRPLGQGDPGSAGAQGGAGAAGSGAAGAGAGGAGAGGAAGAGAAAARTTYELNSLVPQHERDRNELLQVGTGRCWHHLCIMRLVPLTYLLNGLL